MEKVVIGIDIAKDSFTACIAKSDEEKNIRFSEVMLFKNNKTGFNQLIKWVRKSSQKNNEKLFVMEATGVYYEQLAHHLYKLKENTVVVLPNKVKFFAKSLNIKSKNDIIDARIIAQMALERKLNQWEPPKPVFNKIRHLTRLNTQLQDQRTVFSNMLHSKEIAVGTPKEVIKATKKVIDTITKQINEVQKQIKKILSEDEFLNQKLKNILAIKGLSHISVATVIAETNGFNMVENVRQLVSYAGLDVREFQSGTSINRKTHISKKGNKHIRRVLYMPAINVANMEPAYDNFYRRINEKHNSKKPGIIAMERKILILMYALWKSEQKFDPNYSNKKQVELKAQPALDH